jgi:uncharacterized protein YhbP (UPF0306 family)
MNQQKLNSIAKKILKDNIYLTLATAGVKPWAAPLFYCKDPDNNFYFISQMSSVHTKHILKNPRAAFAIFDSHAPEGKGNGIQGEGRVKMVTDKDIPSALKWYHTSFIEVTENSFRWKMPYRLFKLTPSKFYILDPDAKTDKRVEVKLN